MDCVVPPDYRGRSVGSKLIEARFDLVQKLNLRGMVAGSLISDYHRVAAAVPVEQYVQDVIAGRHFDNNLSKQLHKGFKARGIIPNYSVAASSCGYAVEIVWDNPHYRPTWRVPLRPILRRPAVHHHPSAYSSR